MFEGLESHAYSTNQLLSMFENLVNLTRSTNS